MKKRLRSGNRISSKKRPSLVLLGAALGLGPGRASLLYTIGQTGSISAAARAMGMSYRRAWLLVDGMNQRFRKPLVVASQGGSGGGGANVTDFGREVLRRYNALEAKAAAAVSKEIKQFEALMVLK